MYENLFSDSNVGSVVSNALGGILSNAATGTFQQLWKSGAGRPGTKSGHLSAPQFDSVRKILRAQRTHLACLAYHLNDYSDGRRPDGLAPVLFPGGKVLAAPIQVGSPWASQPAGDEFVTRLVSSADPELERRPNAIVNASRSLMPLGEQGEMQDYVQAIYSIESPEQKYFHNLPSYRLLMSDETSGAVRLQFVKSSYFDYQRSSEVLCFEFAYRLNELICSRPELDDVKRRGALFESLDASLTTRRLASPWSDLSTRHAVGGLNVLLLIRRAEGDHRFVMMHRKAKLASAMGTNHVIPAGEFQPSSTAPELFREECNLWFTFLREFAEEILLYPRAETHAADAYSFDGEEPFASMLREVRRGEMNLWFLGHCFDPLSLKAELLCTAVIEEPALERLLRQGYGELRDTGRLPVRNSEGELFSGRDHRGIPFDHDNVMDYLLDPKTLPAGSACLELALRHREHILKH